MMVLRIAATVAILGGLVWIIEIDAFVNSVLDADAGRLVVAALLLPVNITLEAWKWRALLRAGSKTTTSEAFGSILAGYALGLFTPGRAGDYVGRILYLRSDGFQTAIQTGVDRVISMSVYVGAGLIALVVSFWTGLIEFSNPWIYVTMIGSALALGLIALVSRPELFYLLLSRVSRADKWVHGIRFMHGIGKRLFLRLLALSVLRYIVFTSQLVVLVIAFGGESTILLMYVCASLVFFVKTMLPSFTFADLGIRETASVFFFGLLGVEPVAALSASLTLFALNLVVPAIVGAVFVPRLRLPVRLRKSLRAHLVSIAR